VTVEDLLDQKKMLINYLLKKVQAGDWHAIQDSASDIRELDAKLEILAELDKKPPSMR